jgi:hypothetical protein
MNEEREEKEKDLHSKIKIILIWFWGFWWVLELYIDFFFFVYNLSYYDQQQSHSRRTYHLIL